MGAGIKSAGDNLVDISRQTLAAILPFSCPAAALTHAPDTEGALEVCEYGNLHFSSRFGKLPLEPNKKCLTRNPDYFRNKSPKYIIP